MKEQLISFETAKLAKEKGFKLLTNPFGFITKYYHPKTKTLLSYGRTGRLDLNKAYYASTQSLLQKWLREEHDIVIHMVPCKACYSTTGGRDGDIIEIDNELNAQLKGGSRTFDYELYVKGHVKNKVSSHWTYEEALEDALKKSLNLSESK